MLRLRGAPLAVTAQALAEGAKARAYAGEEEEDRAEEPHPINGGVLGKKKTKKTKTKKKKIVVVDSSHEHEDPDSLISPVIGRNLSINCLLHLSIILQFPSYDTSIVNESSRRWQSMMSLGLE